MLMLPALVVVFALLASLAPQADACTNLLVERSLSTDGSNIISYNADAANFYTSIYHYPATEGNKNGTMRQIYSWDYGTHTGEIEEAEFTYNVIGNVNEFGLIITESTFGGLQELVCDKRVGIVDYGSLIWVTLQRSRTAREAIATMAGLVERYGYASTGESFSIADQEEMWYMELIGKGKYDKGAVWVARRVPAGYATGHANQARITTFPQNDPDTLYSPDVISFARTAGFYQGDDASFSFSDVYDPVTFDGARFCEARVWSFFSTIMGQAWSDRYLDYAQGYNLTNRMPLWVKPDGKISPQDVMQSMRSHYEGTALDTTGTQFPDVGAGAFEDPIRNHPITWTSTTPENKGKTYFNERTIAQSPTGWSIVCQSRADVAREMAALMWFGIDDSSTSVHFPVYGSSKRVSKGWAGKGPQDGVTPPLMQFSLDSAFYVFNLVANWAYSRWDAIYPDVHAKILEKEAIYFEEVAARDEEVRALLGEGKVEAAVEAMTSFSEAIGDALLKDWFVFFGEMFVKYRDGYVISASEESQNCGCKVANGAYPQQWLDRIVGDTQEHYKVPSEAQLLQGQGQGQGPRGNGGVRDSRKLELLSRR
mmetsp:Transcript_4911/g.10699  ORF Transcript_4911/g.10699 Transcript_4911/m.10699 type:complete len:596 (+) Transcript_4911:80-1867(+)